MSNFPEPNEITKAPVPALANAEEGMTKALALGDSNEVRAKFRKELVPMAFGVYKILMLDEDPKVRKAAADSVMKIEGSLAPPSQANAGSGGAPTAVFNFDLAGLSEGLRKVAGGSVIRPVGRYEEQGETDER